MDTKAITIHACEQVLRFTQAAVWDDLSEERKVQLGFNLGMMAMSLGISKTDGYDALASARQGQTSMPELRTHFARLITQHGIEVRDEMITRSFA